MSLNEFWTTVRRQAGHIAPRVVADSPSIDAGYIQRMLQGAVLWLTPRSVEGFNPEEFDFLPPAERKDLEEAVTGFLKSAKDVPSDKPATDDQIESALPHFKRILDILRLDKYADPDALRIGKSLEMQLGDQLADTVADLRFETGEDVGTEPALWIWVVLRDAAAKKDVLGRNVMTIERKLRNAVAEARIGYTPYIRFRTESDLKPPVARAKK